MTGADFAPGGEGRPQPPLTRNNGNYFIRLSAADAAVCARKSRHFEGYAGDAAAVQARRAHARVRRRPRHVALASSRRLAFWRYFHNNETMKIQTAVQSLVALAQETRLAVFRLLVEAGPGGMNAGAIAEAVGVPAATLSFHLKELSRAGLVVSRQESRFVFYSANFSAMDDLIAYLTDNCCQGGQCLPKTAAATAPSKRSRKAA